MLKLFDTHTHYDDKAFNNDRHDLIEAMFNMEEYGVAGFMAVGCNPKRNKKAIELAEIYDNVFAAVGIHPGDVKNLTGNYLENLKSLALHKKTAAIGETGLDYHYEGHDKNVQKKIFKEQLELAKELSLPVIVHSRDAAADTMDILSEYMPSALMHCFSGSAETARELVKMGIFISFTGVLTFKNAKKAVEAAKVVPVEMLMLETDCPYMAPDPFRGKRCDSSMAWYIAEKLAEIKNLTTEGIIKICNDNAKRFFNIDF